MKEMRDKGLCFKCNNKWGLDHKCGGPNLFLIEEIDEGEVNDLGVKDLIDLGDPQEEDTRGIEISLHVMAQSQK